MRLFHVDAFSAVPFRGNPAAVCLLDEPRQDPWLAAVAAEMNLSETAFVARRDDGAFDLRWFTPAVEVDLCGHATLAAAHVLWETGDADPATAIAFHTLSGVLTARRDGDDIVLDFPAEPAEIVAAPSGLLGSLGVEADVVVARNRFDFLVELDSAADVRALRPDMARLAQVPARGVIVTAPSDDDACDFISRWFGPQVGVDEDPVTGSAHCCLGPWWAARLGRDELLGYQASARGGHVGVRMVGARVQLSGAAVTVARGELVDSAI